MDKLETNEVISLEEVLSIMAREPVTVRMDYDKEQVLCELAQSNKTISCNVAYDSKRAVVYDCVKQFFAQSA